MKLNLTRPLVFFDLETTGTSVTHDRIVEISYIKIFPDGSEESETMRVNPGIPIPAASTAVHHITDEMVASEPTFDRIANKIEAVFDNSDIAGYNSNKFDVPLLIEEFGRVGKKFIISGRNFVDVQNIFHKMEQRTLVAAYRFYCGKELEEAHSANADTRATYEVLMAQLDRYPSLDNDIKKLADFSRSGRGLDLAARVVLDDNDVPVFNFGKHKGRPVKEVFKKERSFYSWIMQGDFPRNTKDVLSVLYFEVYPPKSK
ncbi:MAG: 3'-5' exonuclease [Bacteroidales bacterium]|nr:3'-5' exonuclease [Bacteroidales bacterium]MBD5223968.1 3'-5' exonuclease [Bacteroidales bacterium]MBD5349116.1 3'-5' exonuclease [Bacteroides sp.]